MVVDGKIIAVHVGGDKAKFNIGRIIDASLITNLWKWREELNASPNYLKDHKVCPHAKEKLEKMQYSLELRWKRLQSVDLQEYTNLLELDLYHNNLQ